MTPEQLKELKDYIRQEVNSAFIWIILIVNIQFVMINLNIVAHK